MKMKANPVAVLPSLCTLGNALCGFAAITLTMKALAVAADLPAADYNLGRSEVMLAGYFVLLAMVFDALDGRLARIARATSDFGGQLDSVADVVSFGVAPAFLMNRVVVESLKHTAPKEVMWVTWVCAAVYLGCALIRLARFNVENEEDEEAHMSFKGLPTPAAAGMLVSVVIFLAACWQANTYPRLTLAMLWLLPLLAVVLGLLMVSNVEYEHLLNHVFRKRRPISHLVVIVLTLAFAVLGLALVPMLWLVGLVAGFGGYALSGPIIAAYRRMRGRGAAAEPEATLGEENGPLGED
ncbi:MAG: CDP-diacylglycerol--serine O-phosphatidyltransferase [Phycisphaerae bacterium]|nr:CDP-diacylglycerol--serine O-phosphatidyltransferase [Phycisphaerae bacterium]